MPFPATKQALEAEGYQFLEKNTCRGCQSRIEFWFTPARKRIPMNPMPDPTSPAISHFTDCPKAAEFRKSK